MWVLAGLGNPGKEYEGTRHNLGFALIDKLCRKWNIGLSKTSPHAVFEVIHRRQEDIALVKPITYMNRSGQALRELLPYFQVRPDRLIVAHDDLDLPLGTVKLRSNCGPGSHNGVASVIDLLQTENFGRIRFGIGPRPQDWAGADFVLSPFEEQELPLVDSMLSRSAKAIETLLARGFDIAMNQLNRKPDSGNEGLDNPDHPVE